GSRDQEFLLDSFAGNAKHKAVMQKHPEMVHAAPNGATIGVSDKVEVFWRFTKTGTFEYACLLPGHYEAGMKGVVVVATRKQRRGK
ncbi:MAG: plastocyanin/azurin family copper-binding protein, partial [Hyphomicrobiaceae bacterium]